MKMTGQMKNCGGIPLFIPNDVTNVKKDFYISYNSHSSNYMGYGCDTTALVLERDFTKFLILNGDHTKEYDEIISKGGKYKDCLEYFKNNLDKQNKHSENWYEKVIFTDEKGLHVIKDDTIY